MTWDRGPVNPKYRTKQHRDLRAHYVRLIQSGQPLDCTAKVCVFNRAPITNPNGNARDGLHLGHADDGASYDGPQHNACNVRDGAVRARAKQDAPEPHRWVL